MVNFTLRRDEYRWATCQTKGLEIGQKVSGTEVRVYYMKGTRARGVFVSVGPKEWERTQYGHCESFGLLSGMTMLVMPLERKNDKRVLGVAVMLDAHVLAIAEAYITGGKEKAGVLIRDVMGMVAA